MDDEEEFPLSAHEMFQEPKTERQLAMREGGGHRSTLWIDA